MNVMTGGGRHVEDATAKNTRACIIVAGMHRSGTSAFARVLNLLGAALPRDLLDTGIQYWEPRPLVERHDAMLRAAGSGWDDWRAFRPDDLAAGSLDRFKAEISDIVAEQFDGAPLFVLKDPRICRFVPLYRDVLDDLGVTPQYLLALRNPLSVMRSLAVRNDMTPGYAGLLWLRHVLEAEQATRGAPRVIASYENLLHDWRRMVADLAPALGLPAPTPAQAAEIDAFLSTGLQHHAFASQDLDERTELPAWIKETYASMRLLEQDSANLSALGTLDRVRTEFFPWASVFGEACIPELAAHKRELERRLADSAAAQSERDALRAQYDAACRERDDLRVHYGAAYRERDALRAHYEAACRERDALRLHHEAACRERDALRAQYDAACEEREVLRVHYDAAYRERDALRLHHEAACRERDALRVHRDAACEERDALAIHHAAACRERDALRLHHEVACRERDAVRATLEAERQRISRSRWWRLAEQLRAVERRLRVSRKRGR